MLAIDAKESSGAQVNFGTSNTLPPPFLSFHRLLSPSFSFAHRPARTRACAFLSSMCSPPAGQGAHSPSFDVTREMSLFYPPVARTSSSGSSLSSATVTTAGTSRPKMSIKWDSLMIKLLNCKDPPREDGEWWLERIHPGKKRVQKAPVTFSSRCIRLCGDPDSLCTRGFVVRCTCFYFT